MHPNICQVPLNIFYGPESYLLIQYFFRLNGKKTSFYTFIPVDNHLHNVLRYIKTLATF